jgi:hypothetical protein
MNYPKVALMQPAFLPWIGYFELMKNSDIFIFLNDFQFVRRGRGQRNTLLNHEGKEFTISLSVESSPQKSTFEEMRPILTQHWKDKFLKHLFYIYGKSPYYNNVIYIIKKWLDGRWDNLGDMLIDFSLEVAIYIGIKVTTYRSSNLSYDRNLRRSARLASILKTLNAGCYLSAKGSFSYMLDDRIFPLDWCPVFFQDHIAKPYYQPHTKEFVKNLSIIDVLFNVPPHEIFSLVDGTVFWKNWEQMLHQLS